MVNIISKKKKYKIRYFYFDFYQTKGSKIRFYIQKLKKIYSSFNVFKGIEEYNFIYSQTEIKDFKNKLSKIKKNSDLIKFKINKVKIGDLIYDYYMRTTLEPTLKLNDKRFKEIFFKKNKIFKESNKYLSENNVKILIPSHLCYITYGIITRIALLKKIKVLKLRTENRGNSSFRLMKIDKFCVDEPKYYLHRKTFKKLSKSKQKYGLQIGKKILLTRTSGQFDPTLPYIKKSQFRKKKIYYKMLI